MYTLTENGSTLSFATQAALIRHVFPVEVPAWAKYNLWRHLEGIAPTWYGHRVLKAR